MLTSAYPKDLPKLRVLALPTEDKIALEQRAPLADRAKKGGLAAFVLVVATPAFTYALFRFMAAPAFDGGLPALGVFVAALALAALTLRSLAVLLTVNEWQEIDYADPSIAAGAVLDVEDGLYARAVPADRVLAVLRACKENRDHVAREQRREQHQRTQEVLTKAAVHAEHPAPRG